MKNSVLVAIAIMMLSVSNAKALSVEERSNTNSDGTPKFADPDEKAPPFLVMPETDSGSNSSDSSDSSVNRPIAPNMQGGSHQGEEAFDKAYSHLQMQNQ